MAQRPQRALPPARPAGREIPGSGSKAEHGAADDDELAVDDGGRAGVFAEEVSGEGSGDWGVVCAEGEGVEGDWGVEGGDEYEGAEVCGEEAVGLKGFEGCWKKCKIWS